MLRRIGARQGVADDEAGQRQQQGEREFEGLARRTGKRPDRIGPTRAENGENADGDAGRRQKEQRGVANRAEGRRANREDRQRVMQKRRGDDRRLRHEQFGRDDRRALARGRLS